MCLEQHAAALTLGLGPHHRLRAAVAHESDRRRSSERLEGGEVTDRLQQVGLTFAVGSDDGREPVGRGLELDLLVVPEVGQPQPVQSHGGLGSGDPDGPEQVEVVVALRGTDGGRL